MSVWNIPHGPECWWDEEWARIWCGQEHLGRVAGYRAAHPGRLRSIWNRLRGRHSNGSRHDWQPAELGPHGCQPLSYCHHEHHYCCGKTRVTGYAVEEVR